MEAIVKWTDKIYGVILGFAVIWGGWYFAKSQKLKKADEDQAFVNVMDQMIPVIDKIQSPLMKDLERMNLKLDTLTDDYIKIQIKLGVMENTLREKDAALTRKDERIKELEGVIDQQRIEISRLKISL